MIALKLRHINKGNRQFT